jgi:hypothetical protein
MKKEKVTLFLEKDGERTEYTFKISMWSLLKSAKKINHFIKEGWKLIDCTGDNQQFIGFIRKQIQAYEANSKTYSGSVKETVVVASNIVGVDVSKIKSVSKFFHKKQADVKDEPNA